MANAGATHKRCRTCGGIKPMTDFELRRDGRGGRRTTCLPCRLRHYHPYKQGRPKLHPQPD